MHILRLAQTGNLLGNQSHRVSLIQPYVIPLCFWVCILFIYTFFKMGVCVCELDFPCTKDDSPVV